MVPVLFEVVCAFRGVLGLVAVETEVVNASAVCGVFGMFAMELEVGRAVRCVFGTVAEVGHAVRAVLGTL